LDRSIVSRRRLATLLALSAAAPAFSAHAFDLPDPASPTKAIDQARRLTVQVRVNDRGPYPFLIDTGANASVISSDLAAELGLSRGPQVRLHSIAGEELVDTVVVDTVTVGRRVRRGMNLAVAPGRFLRAAGILGRDWLGSQGLILDFARNQMRLGSQAPRDDDLAVSVPVKLQRSGLYMIEAAVVGTSTLVFLDTGSTTTVGNMALWEQVVKRRLATRDWADVELQSVTGQVLSGRLAALRFISLGKMTLRNVPVVFGPVHTFAYWGLADRPAILIGNDILNTFESVALDFTRGQVHFRLASSSRGRSTAAS
jgi:predicted aspartyl protease